MKKLISAMLFGVLALTACSGEEDSKAETADEASSEEETAEEQNKENESSEEAASEDGSDDVAKEATHEEEDMESAFRLNPQQADVIENVKQSDKSVEDVIQPPSEVTSYKHETVIHFSSVNDGQVTKETEMGLTAEVYDAEDKMVMASEMIDENREAVRPHGYVNTENDEILLFKEGEWTDASSQYSTEEMVNGIYSNAYDMISQMSDLLEVQEAEDYYVLYYSGNDQSVFDIYKEKFNIEFTGPENDGIKTGMVAFINKETGVLESVKMKASSTGSEEELVMIGTLNYTEYGALDAKDIERPDIETAGGKNAGESGEENESTGGDISEADLEDIEHLDADKTAVIKDMKETGESVEEVLQPVSEVTSYLQETLIAIKIAENGQVIDQRFGGNKAQIYESDEKIKISSDFLDQNYNVTGPHGYADSESGEMYIYSDQGWTDFSSQYEPEELIYGTYSNIHEIISQLPDSLKVMEANGYDILYYTGNDESVFELYQETFNLEFSGTDQSTIQTGFMAFINKESGELESAALLAKGNATDKPEQEIIAEIVLNYSDYGAFDNKDIKKPEMEDVSTSSTEDEGIEGSID